MGRFYQESDIEEVISSLGEIAQKLSGKTILLSGGLGFLGKYIIQLIKTLNRETLKSPCKLIAVDNFITSDPQSEYINEDTNYRIIKHDICKPFSQIEEKVDYVVHVAGIASPFHYNVYPLETFDVAITGTRNMLEIALKNSARFLFFSSSEIYGNPDDRHIPTPESYWGNVSCQGLRACYDESKRAGETLCSIYHAHLGVHTNVVRPFNIYGPGMLENDFRVMSNFASRIKGGKPLRVYDNGNQTRTFCYITDAMNGFFRVLLKGISGNVYNIGNPKPEISIIALAKMIDRILNRNIKFDCIEYPDSYPADEPQRRCPDIRKARLHLNYKPKVDLEEGLSRFFNWTNEFYIGNDIQ